MSGILFHYIWGVVFQGLVPRLNSDMLFNSELSWQRPSAQSSSI